ncbi:MAG: hypothetical protein SFV23_12675 [Planctomycetaceae bacterium]|nr:hypothetical protein [Planctomycetaceae bacterium]
MPVSLTPILFPLFLVVITLVGTCCSRKAGLLVAGASIAAVLLIVLSAEVPGWALMLRARQDDPAAMYELARWTENRAEDLGEWLPYPGSPNVLGGYALLERAAEYDYPPALYAVGVRLKFGDFVPEPPNWTGPGGNVFPQPERGQPLIDKALALGYQPSVEEIHFYWWYRTGRE